MLYICIYIIFGIGPVKGAVIIEQIQDSEYCYIILKKLSSYIMTYRT